jgi:transcriptional regulator with XRE-family HTH domain
MSEWPLDWRALVEEAIRRRKAEGLSQRGLAALAGVSVPTVNGFEQGDIRLRFERVVAILEALNLIVRTGRPDSFQAFLTAARRRWSDLTSSLPDDHPSRQPQGHSEQAYVINGLPEEASSARLHEALSRAPKTSGWSPFWMPTRPDLRPVHQDGLLECWLGRPDVDRQFNDPAHSDFWRVSRDGQAYLQRGYQEDDPDILTPGTIFDWTLPIWRTAELILHAAHLARAFGAEDDARIRFIGRYTGLEGRELVSWAKPLNALDERYRSRSAKADLAAEAELLGIEDRLELLIIEFLSPLYERFDGFQPHPAAVAAQLRDLRKSAGLV